MGLLIMHGGFSHLYSVGWRITEEAFMKNQKIFDDLNFVWDMV